MEILQNFPLQSLNTFGMQVSAEQLVRVKSVEELSELFAQGLLKDSPFVLGGGSNLLFTRDASGLVLLMEIEGKNKVAEDEETVILEFGAGEVWHDLVMFCVEEGWGGIENLSLIPGKVGAAPIQNIGAYGVELKDVFEYLYAFELESGKLKKFTAEDCRFGYRESVFKQDLKGKYVIVKVALRLSKKPQLNTKYGAIEQELEKLDKSEYTIRDVSNAVIAIRQSKLPDPAEIGNSGSFFKNPEIPEAQFRELQKQWPDIVGYPTQPGTIKVPAGWLIDRAGWKGKRFGEYGVHERQALVLVNYGNAKGSDIYQLSEKILKSIHEIYGIQLEREVNVL